MGTSIQTLLLRDWSTSGTVDHAFTLPKHLLEKPAEGVSLLVAGAEVKDLVLGVASFKRGATNNNTGKPFINMTLSDPSGSIQAVMWENKPGQVDQTEQVLSTSPVVRVNGKVNEWSGALQITVNSIQPDLLTDPASMLPLASNFYDVQQELNTLVEIYGRLEGPERSLTLKGLERYWNEFCAAPAAKRYHHAFIGGLLIHAAQLAKVLEDLRNAPNLVDAMMAVIGRRLVKYKEQIIRDLGKEENPLSLDHVYEVIKEVHRRLQEMEQEGKTINWDACLASTFWHDLGKIGEYQYSTRIDMNDNGKLLGHMAIGARKLHETAHELGLSEADILPIEHIIFSHHGKLEWGAATWPQTVEAWIFHFVDYLGSRFS